MSIALTPTSYLVLGCLAAQGPATPYELKQTVTASVGNFWSFPHSQLYSEPVRLAAAGLLAEEREDSGRRRRSFSITDAGRDALGRWLADPTAQLPEIRDIALLKLFFGALTARRSITALARAQHQAHQERGEYYRQLAVDAPPGPSGATIRLGIAWETAAAEFWAEVLADPPR